jgi:hypothetical protein
MSTNFVVSEFELRKVSPSDYLQIVINVPLLEPSDFLTRMSKLMEKLVFRRKILSIFPVKTFFSTWIMTECMTITLR